MQPDKVIITEVPEYLRGRNEGEVPAVIREEMLFLGASPESLDFSTCSFAGVKAALDWAQEGDLLLLLVHSQREEILRFLQKGERVT